MMRASQHVLGVVAVRAAESDDGAIGNTPPRLSYAEGEVSYFRPGAPDWAPAQVNTALAPGDELYTGNRGNLELQVGARAFVRAWGDSQLGLVNHEPDFLQIKVTGGHVALDLRSVDPGRTVEIDTPQAAFTIERAGYYRVDVTQSGSSFVTRRSGQATMTPAGGQAVAIASSEEVVLEGVETPTVRSYVAPELDVWDRWNYARTEDLIDTISSRYVSAGVYGVDDLDHYGDWRVVPTYGSVWVPQSVPAGWAPYSTGRWIMDPYYGWTWVDTAPWGWAPYHYCRWVFVSGYWAWAPGPVGLSPVQQARIAQIDARHLEPARAPIRVAPDASSFVAASGRATRPPDHTIARAVVATRAPRREGPGPADAARAEGARNEGPRSDGPRAGNGGGAPPPRLLPAPQAAAAGAKAP